jgi:hypothetical protein
VHQYNFWKWRNSEVETLPPFLKGPGNNHQTTSILFSILMTNVTTIPRRFIGKKLFSHCMYQDYLIIQILDNYISQSEQNWCNTSVKRNLEGEAMWQTSQKRRFPKAEFESVSVSVSGPRIILTYVRSPSGHGKALEAPKAMFHPDKLAP